MVLSTHLRILRLRHKIPLNILAKGAGISAQHLSRLERGELPASSSVEKKVAFAVGELIADRKSSLQELEKEYLLHKERLLKPMEVDADEL